jgi:glycerol uptake facilitator-like aquaporin
MSNKPTTQPAQATASWRVPVYLVGTIIGAILGAISAHMYARTAETANPNGPKLTTPDVSDVLRLALTTVGLVRSISDIGKK